MKTLVSIFFLTITSFFLSACGTYDWHQKLTIEVETPDGVKSGSAVAAVSWWENRILNFFFKDGSRLQSELTGEAAVVDLGNSRYLFALLKNADGSGNMADLAMRIMVDRNVIWWNIGDVAAVNLMPRRVVVPLKNFPTLVTFLNIDDPKSVVQIDPNNISLIFGSGFILKSISLEVTSDPVSLGAMEKIIPWLEAVGRDRASLIPYSGAPITDPIRNVTPEDFNTELYK